MLTVSWAQRPDGTTPESTVFTNSELKRYSPLLLCEFYERMLKVNFKKQDPHNIGGQKTQEKEIDQDKRSESSMK